jgi:hypothetical protein
MTQNGRKRARAKTVREVEVRMAQAAGHDPDRYLARMRRLDLDVVDEDQRSPRFLQEGGFHASDLPDYYPLDAIIVAERRGRAR